MMPLIPATAWLAIAVAATAAIVDFRQHRIPNRLTYPLIVVGLALQTALHGWRGLLLSLAGGIVFGGIFLVFYLVRAMGAGDVKLAAALGCIVGLSQSPQLMYAVAVAGGLMALIYILLSGRFKQTMRNLFSVLGYHAKHGLQAHPEVNLENPKALRMPYGLAFAAGTIYWAISSQVWK